jgi:two-component system sensor histidine kinase ChiS
MPYTQIEERFTTALQLSHKTKRNRIIESITAENYVNELPTILIIEDDPDTQSILQQQLTFNDLKTIFKSDGFAGLEWLDENQPDLVLLDLMLPEMDGFEVCRKIREKYLPSALPIIMLSALGGDPKMRIRGLEAGANDFVAKPHDAAELVARIRNLLHLKNEADQADSSLSSYMASALRMQARVDPGVLGRREFRHAVVLFADLRGFSHLVSHTAPEEMLRVLDEFFEEMMATIDEHGGTALDLTGDELLAAFNIPYDLPNPGYRAAQCALHMQWLFRDLQRKWAKAGLTVGLGIGLHQGEVVLGNIGGSQLMRYTVMGDVVNFAHRLVEIAKDGEIVTSQQIYDVVCAAHNGLRATALPDVQLKGMREPHTVYQLKIADVLEPQPATPTP